MKRFIKVFFCMCIFFSLMGCSKLREVTHEDGMQGQMESHTQFLNQLELLYEEAGEIYCSFVNETDGFILHCSDPGGGLMNKRLYITRDAGETFCSCVDITNMIGNYPVGMIFFGNEVGYIITNYHGVSSFLYRTEDGGTTWSPQELITSEDFLYIQGVSIARESNAKAKVVIEVVSSSEKKQFVYVTEDEGKTWIQN